MKTWLRCVAPALAGLFFGCSGAEFSSTPGVVAELQRREPTRAERAILGDKGFVISSEAKVPSFHLGYTTLFKAHEPMYFTADALLHALHTSYDSILMEVEENALMGELGTLVDEMRKGLAKGALGTPESRADIDLYLAVADGLLREKGGAPVAGARPEEAAKLLESARNAAGPATLDLFGEKIEIELSMLKPRGHYTSSPELSRYFQAMMWLGRGEIRLVKYAPDGAPLVNRRALGGVLLLDALLTERARLAYKRIDDTTRAFVGPPDSLSFPGLGRAAVAGGLMRVADLASLGDAEIAKALGGEAAQRIGSSLLGPSRPGQAPIDFLMLGQRYVFDSEVFSSVTYGRLPQKRMMPSPLDVGFAVFENPAAPKLLEPEFQRFGYRGALEAAGKQGAQMGPALWEGSLYHLWLGALRELSPRAERDAALPGVMRSEAWQRRMMSTQLASWAELRHDTLLYAKQSFTATALCEYPDAYIEPYPSFFGAIEKLASKGRGLLAGLDFGAHAGDKTRIEAYFKNLGEVAATLREIAELERQKQPLTDEHLDFINHAVSVDGKHAGCTTILEPGGWYADLHYNRDDVLWHKPTIADVHTQPTDENGNPVGKVLHVGTAAPRLFTVTIDTCKGPQTYKGFVLPYFEHITGNFERLTDEQWWAQVQKEAPPDVPWMEDVVAR